MLGPDQTSENGSASSTWPFQPVPSPWTKPCHSAAACAQVIPGRRTPWTCSIAAAAISFASRMRSTSCSVLIARASARSGVASAASGPGVEPRLRERRRLADHPVARLRAERELEADAAFRRRLARELERAQPGRPRVARVVAGEEPHVLRPGRPRASSAEASRQISTGSPSRGNTTRVVALHPPEVRQVEDVVRRADDDRVELLLGHERADALELRVVAGPGH